ncbi:Uncharacterized protein BM_BM1243 [Brugia malayi]|uniref:Bm1243 n=1 Tax=Brugia malayi TaxID=6279 RepID=A0A0J9XR62_BRUMA|nr:Uncharacterized protein BM_BM1243 [Brugia malayi]CDP94009.1 Bm1243 [Brugia malayi]VIO97309.1 Uncharacterized protein BM_BM1243 [Brugia malayi]
MKTVAGITMSDGYRSAECLKNFCFPSLFLMFMHDKFEKWTQSTEVS